MKGHEELEDAKSQGDDGHQRQRALGCLVLSREWENGLWRLLLGIIEGLL